MASPVRPSRFEGKVAIITGGDRGIGAAVARRLGAEGAAVVIGYRSNAAAAQQLVVERTVLELGRLDVLVCCAGIGANARGWTDRPHLLGQRAPGRLLSHAVRGQQGGGSSRWC